MSILQRILLGQRYLSDLNQIEIINHSRLKQIIEFIYEQNHDRFQPILEMNFPYYRLIFASGFICCDILQ
jgi:hypothetical protein